MRYRASTVAAALLALARARELRAQAEVRPWGSVEGMRIEGQRIPFETRLCTVAARGEETSRTAKERQLPRFARTGDTRTISTRLRALSVHESVTDSARGSATIRVRFAADSGASPDGGAFCVALPRADWGHAKVELIGRTAGPRRAVSLPVASRASDTTRRELLRATARGIRFTLPARTLELQFLAPTAISLRGDPRFRSDDFRLYATVLSSPVVAGASAAATVVLRAGGTIDHAPVTIAVDVAHPGARFGGMGGNFRVENTPQDPPVVAYNLANLRVAWGRVEIPWRAWQPNESDDPSRLSLPPDSLDPRVRRAMEMARTLARRGIPFIASVWFPPRWAVVGELPDARPPGGPTGNALDSTKIRDIYNSLAAYLLYLKRWYGAEPALFSFNESDIGIDVRQTPAEHAEFIKGFGGLLESDGLGTKMLLGDVSDATATWFVAEGAPDRSGRSYVGAVSYHSWRGWEDSLLTHWRGLARASSVPLLVAEGSIDAGAWRYPQVLLEPWYALQESKLYVRILALSQPASILPWELTSDYSLLAGGGIFGDTASPMHPTERFFVVKQLASVPPNAFHVPVHCDRAETSCAALADPASGVYTVHVVNDGASRPATITGLPTDVTELRVYITDATRGMAEGARVPVHDGVARLTLDATSFTTLVGAR